MALSIFLSLLDLQNNQDATVMAEGQYIGKMTTAWSPESHVTCLAEMTWVA